MRKSALIFIWFLLSFFSSKAAYVEQQIYVCLTAERATLIVEKEGSVSGAHFKDWMGSILTDYEVTDVRVPFFNAFGTPLQRILQITFRTPHDIDGVIATLGRHGSVEYAEKVGEGEYFGSYQPNDLGLDAYSGQWYLHKIQAPEAWVVSKGNRQIKVAIVDQAVDLNHEDLREVIWTNPDEIPDNGIDDDANGYIDDVHGYDIAENDADPNPDIAEHYHGTHVAGIVSAKSDNGIGIASMGFDVAIIPVKTAYKTSTFGIPYEGVIYAANAGADIINCSWGGYPFSITQKQVIEYAQKNGCLVVCSAGNDGKEGLDFPAAYEGVVSVGATTKEDKMVPFSNYGSALSISAPGYQILSTMPGDQYFSLSGTSMSAPLVSGLLALMKAHYPEATNEQLKSCLLSTADSVPVQAARYANKTGAGRINALRAMQCIDALKNGTSGIAAEGIVAKSSLVLYPNPAQDQVYITVPFRSSGPITLSIMDIQGQVLRRETVPYSPDITLSVNELPSGMYILEINNGQNRSQGKFVINHN